MTTLRSVLQPVATLLDLLEDTMILSASEAFMAALACYHAFKAAEKL